MGNKISKTIPEEARTTGSVRDLSVDGLSSKDKDVDPNTCLICWDEIDTSHSWCLCLRCDIQLHYTCEKKYRGHKEYTECPHCRRIDTIGFYEIIPTLVERLSDADNSRSIH